MSELWKLINLLESELEAEIDLVDDGGMEKVAYGVVRPNLQRLKELAHDNFLYLANAYERLKTNPKKQLLVCEALQHRSRRELIPFFLRLLKEGDDERASCAAIALGKTKCRECIPIINARLRTTESIRLMFYLGFALILLEEPEGVESLLQVLETERDRVAFNSGRIVAQNVPEIFCVRVALILGSLFDDFAPDADPFRWIVWAQHDRDRYESFDAAKIPDNLVEYHARFSD